MRDELAIWNTKNGTIRAEWNFTNLTIYRNDRAVGFNMTIAGAMALVNELAGEVVWSI
jgi:hypothetical protein